MKADILLGDIVKYKGHLFLVNVLTKSPHTFCGDQIFGDLSIEDISVTDPDIEAHWSMQDLEDDGE